MRSTGLLHTVGWVNWTDPETDEVQRVCREIIIPFHKIYAITEHDNDKGDTCLVSVTEETAFHVDIPLKQMKKILKEHYRDPDKDFETHPQVR